MGWSRCSIHAATVLRRSIHAQHEFRVASDAEFEPGVDRGVAVIDGASILHRTVDREALTRRVIARR